jgi:hypothetical protein
VYEEFPEKDKDLNIKVIFFMGIKCLTRQIELYDLKYKDIQFKNCSKNSQICCSNYLEINIKKRKTSKIDENSINIIYPRRKPLCGLFSKKNL